MGGPGWGGSPDDRERIRRELEEERETHLLMRTEELVSLGMRPEEARAEAERRYGDLDEARLHASRSAARLARRARREAAADATRRWLTFAVRRVRHHPAPTLVAMLVFALGVGLTTSIFTVVDHVLLRPLPFPDPDQLVSLQGVGRQGNPIPVVSMGNWVDWKDGSASLAGTAIYSAYDATVLTGDRAFWASAATVRGQFFETLGLPVREGRPLAEHDGQEQAPVVVVSSDFWARVFGGNPDLASLELVVNGNRVEVVGVVEQGQDFPGGTDVWIPAPYRPESGGMRNNINYEAVARLGPSVTMDAAERELAGIARSIRERDPEALYSYGVHVLPLQDVVVGDAGDWLRLLGVAVAFVLLIACANLAGLSLAQGRKRERDTAVRLALGAAPGHLVGEELVAHLVTALMGGCVGVILAAASSGIVTRAFAGLLPRSAEVGFDARIAAFGILAALTAGLLSGFVPAIRASRGMAHGLSSDARGSVRGGRGLPGALMVGSEVAIAVALLVGGGLLLRSLVTVASRDLGYEPEGVVTLRVRLSSPEYRSDLDRRMAYWDALVQSITATPGVEAVGLGNWIPTDGGGTSFIEVDGQPEQGRGAGYRVVSDDYFDAMGIPLLSGRRFGATDSRGTGRVGLVNRTAASVFWPDVSPVGRRIKAPSMEATFRGGEAEWITVVGVVGDVRQYGFEADPMPELFVLHRQIPEWTSYMSAVVKLKPGAPPGITEVLTATARGLDPSLAVESAALSTRVRGLLTERRLVLGVLGVFGAVSLLLVCLGIYGLVSFAVAQRTREIAVRAALGAARGGILALMLGSALRVVLSGAGAGLLAAVMLRGLLDAMVVGVGTTDPLTYVGATLLMVIVALLAALLPSLRAARMDPLEALRRE